MDQRKKDLIEAGRWLSGQRAETGASSSLVARMATLVANRQGDPVKIHQQQISEIENAGPDKGPRSLRPWFRYVRAAFDSGLIAEALGKAPPDTAENPRDEVFYIQSESGEIVGRLTWFARRSE